MKLIYKRPLHSGFDGFAPSATTQSNNINTFPAPA